MRVVQVALLHGEVNQALLSPVSQPEALAKDFEFALGAFLIAASDTAFFGYSDGWYFSGTTWHEQYDRKLGVPLGLAKQGTGSANMTWTRKFASGTTVELDVAHKNAEIRWATDTKGPIQLYVVAPSAAGSVGAEAADGSVQRPFTSITDARDALRRMQPAGGAVVNIGCGVHAPLQLTAADSGSTAAPITYRGATGADGEPCALVSAGMAIPSAAFRPWPARPGVVVANLTKLGMRNFGDITGGDLQDCQNQKAELFYDGAPMALARWPNNPRDAPNGQTWARAKNGTGEAGLIVGAECPALAHEWASAPDGWIHA